ncbi:MAG: spermidine/putrescine ABC transporter substrate-binding protein [Proteobacteria bacterium]|nr:MAG: spermidine/putrescine ABC transporter substrate-binding protein [Rhodobacter sp. BACL10 MAG-120910-bin24]MDA0355349.1 spermidine/putrescine ABC transporter substrate-binding protein [Pseudomonadota bacterium]MDA1043190.1 spermidine/putrescine ABC transporter substrate-binding protein [Pseudomonadota bacterium]
MKKQFSNMGHLNRRNLLQRAVAAGLSVAVVPSSLWAASGELNIYNWDTYIGETTVDTFSAATGANVQYDLFADNEELFAKLKEGNPGYDLIFPSDYMVETMITLDMLVEIDHSKVPNIKNLIQEASFIDPPFNPGLKYGVPYMWGTVGIGYRKSKVPAVPTSWSALFENDELAGRIALLADARVVLGIALKYLGYSMNTRNSDEIAKARDLIIAAKKNIKTFAPDSGQDLLISGEVDLVMEWNGDIISVIAEDDDLAYVVPDEGSVVWMDNICIPKGAPNIENALAFINHIHDPEVNAEIANTIHYATANAAAKKSIAPDDLANPAIYPTDDIVAKCEALVDVGDDARLYDEAWTQVNAG